MIVKLNRNNEIMQSGLCFSSCQMENNGYFAFKSKMNTIIGFDASNTFAFDLSKNLNQSFACDDLIFRNPMQSCDLILISFLREVLQVFITIFSASKSLFKITYPNVWIIPWMFIFLLILWLHVQFLSLCLAQ